MRYVSIYKDTLSKNWIVDADGGTRERPGRNREGFSSWPNATRAASVIALGWKLAFPQLQVRTRIEAVERAHAKAAQARLDRLQNAA